MLLLSRNGLDKYSGLATARGITSCIILQLALIMIDVIKSYSIQNVRRHALPCMVLALSCMQNIPCFAESCTVRGLSSYRTLKEGIDATLERESNGYWQKIHWETNTAVALQRAQQENKPIFILFLENEKLPRMRGKT